MVLEEYRCDQVDCDVITKTKQQRKDHQLSHNKDKKTCEECGKDFNSQRSLNIHQGRIHPKGKDETVSASAPVPEGETEDEWNSLIIPSPSRKFIIKELKAKKVIKDEEPTNQKSSTPKLKVRKRKSFKLKEGKASTSDLDAVKVPNDVTSDQVNLSSTDQGDQSESTSKRSFSR